MTGILQWTNHGGIASLIAIIALIAAVAGIYGETRPRVIVLVSIVLAALAAGAYWPETKTTACLIYVVMFLVIAVGFPLLIRSMNNAPMNSQCP